MSSTLLMSTLSSFWLSRTPLFSLIVSLLFLFSATTPASAARNGLLSSRRTRLFHTSTSNTFNSGQLATQLNIRPSANSLTRNRPVVDVNGNTIPDYNVVYTFDQLIDHNNPSRGTFKQRYFHTWEYYQPGGPIVLMTPGEQSMDGSELLLTNASMVGHIARSTSGAAILLEHRFYGESQPFADLSVSSLRVHTIEQAMQDLVYFAENAKLAMPGEQGEGVRPGSTPWILLGGSYAGALVSWTLSMNPTTFWSAYSSSGVIQPLLDFHQYFAPIQTHMPRNCSLDVQRVIEHVDGVLGSGDGAAYDDLLTAFGFTDLERSDFANALTFPIAEWQVLDIDSARGSAFYTFCDALEVQNGVVAGEDGWGLEVALAAWGQFYRGAYLDELCGGFAPDDCVRFDGSTSAGVEINDDRAWMWQVCSEVGWAQVGPPADVRGIVSRFFTVQNYTNYCNDAFAGAFSPSESFEDRVARTAETYGGLAARRPERLFIVNGERDPWLEVTHSSTALVSTRLASTPSSPIFLTDGFHCSDVLSSNRISASINEVFDEAGKTFSTWVSEFQSGGGGGVTGGGTGGGGAAGGGRNGGVSSVRVGKGVVVGVAVAALGGLVL